MRTSQKSWRHYLQIFSCLMIVFLDYGISSSDNRHLRLSHNIFTEAEGTEVKVDCHAVVSETPRTLKWISSHDQEASSQSRSSDGNTVRLIISSLRRFDAGTYTCLLVTASGEEEKAEVHIFVRPRNRDTQVCRPTQFKCKVTKYCIFLKYRCDGLDDCGDGSDEECPGDPCADRFICNNTRCVDHRFRCDHKDNCGDNSDERACYEYRYRGDKMSSTTDPHGASGDNDDSDNYSWVKSTIYTIIASTIGLVILISIGVILVFRAKMKRIRERRMVRALNAMQIYGGLEEPRIPPMTGDGCVEEEPFLPRTAQRYHQGPSIIFNVNNGVQYMPRYRYMVENPPPYSEVLDGENDGANDRDRRNGNGGGGVEQVDNTPPPYSTLDRSGEASQETDGPRNTFANRDQNRHNQRYHRNLGTRPGIGEESLPSRSIVGHIGNSGNFNVSSSSPSSNPQIGACVSGMIHSGAEYCTGCVHCVPSSSTNSASSGNVVGRSNPRHDNQRASSGMGGLNHHPSLSQGQGPVLAREGRQHRGNEQYQHSPGNTQLSGITLTQLTGINGEFRGMDINSHLLQNLLTSSSSSSSHNDSHRLRASVDSESSSNESHGSAASSSSSCGDDSVSSCTLLGIAGPSSNGRDSIHETETLKTRDRDVPCLPVGRNSQQPDHRSLPVDDTNSSTDESERPVMNVQHQSELDVCSANDRDSTTTPAAIINHVLNDISVPSLPNSSSAGAGVSYSGGVDGNDTQHLLVNENLDSSLPQSHNDNNTSVSPVATSLTQSDDHDNVSASYTSSNQTNDQPSTGGSNVDSAHSTNQKDSVASSESLPSPSSSSTVLGPEDASSALLQEVANRDRNSRQKSKQGHLSVHKGQIVLHTSDGILAGQSIIPIVPSSSSPSSSASSGEASAPHLSGEIIVKDGNIMLQIPVGRSLAPSGHVGFPCMENITHQQVPSPSLSPSASSTSTPCFDPIRDHQRVEDSTNYHDKNLASSSTPSSSQQPTSSIPTADGSSSPLCHSGVPSQNQTPKPDQGFVSGGDLNIRDGQLVLEPPKPKTPSSQILSHLQGAECLSSSLSGVQEEEDGIPIGPVGNDKRQRPAASSATGSHRHHQPTSKSFNSDRVLPRGKN